MTGLRRSRVTRVEFIVPAPPPYGADRSDIEAAIRSAQQEMGPKQSAWRSKYLISDSIRFSSGDDEIIVWYEYEEPDDDEPTPVEESVAESIMARPIVGYYLDGREET
jgi:hypothetical protein